MSPAMRRAFLAGLVKVFVGCADVTERSTCKLLGWPRSTMRYVPKGRPRDARLGRLLPVLAALAPRQGARRLRGWVCRWIEPISKNAFHRLWKTLNLQVKPRRRHRAPRKKVATIPGLRATAPHQIWCLDFLADWTMDRRRLRFLSVVDEYTRRCLALVVRRRFTAEDVLDVLSCLVHEHRTPSYLRSDNGPEFIATVVEGWEAEMGVTPARSEPASPWQNPYAESFHSRLREELVEENVFGSLEEAQVLAEAYRQWYNDARRHSSLDDQTPSEFAARVRTTGPVLGQPGLAEAQA